MLLVVVVEHTVLLPSLLVVVGGRCIATRSKIPLSSNRSTVLSTPDNGRGRIIDEERDTDVRVDLIHGKHTCIK